MQQKINELGVSSTPIITIIISVWDLFLINKENGNYLYKEKKNIRRKAKFLKLAI